MAEIQYDLVLGSASPRRKQLLEQAGYRLLVLVPDIKELPKSDESPLAYITRNSREKSEAIRNLPNCPLVLPIVTADTIVVLGSKILEKPQDVQDAIRMLKSLSGKEHEVITAVTVARGSKVHSFATETKVKFRELLDLEIQRYVASGEPMDKAGGYGIQGGAAGMVEAINGSYTNVVGLPIGQLMEVLRREFDSLI